MFNKKMVCCLVLTGLVLLISCSQKNSQTSTKLKIAGIVFQDDQFFKLIEFGMKDAATKNNCELDVANTANALDKEISSVDTYITQKVNAIVISPLSTKGSVEALKRANDAGIKVVTYNTAIAADFPVCDIESDQVDLGGSTGKAAVKYIQEKLNGKANIAMLEFMSLSPEQSGERVRGFKDTVSKLPGVKIVAEQDAWLAPDAVDKVESILTAHPDVDIIWAANEGGTVGAVGAVRNAHKAGKVVVFGTDMSEQLGDFLLADDNVLQAVTGQKPFDIGSMSVEMAVKALNGQPVDKKISLPGSLFTRDEAEEVKIYKKRLQELSK